MCYQTENFPELVKAFLSVLGAGMRELHNDLCRESRMVPTVCDNKGFKDLVAE